MPDLYTRCTDDELRDLMATGDEEAAMELQSRQHDYTIIPKADAQAAGMWLDFLDADDRVLRRTFRTDDDDAAYLDDLGTREARDDDRADGLLA